MLFFLRSTLVCDSNKQIHIHMDVSGDSYEDGEVVISAVGAPLSIYVLTSKCEGTFTSFNIEFFRLATCSGLGDIYMGIVPA